MSGGIFGCHSVGVAAGLQWVEARGMPHISAMHGLPWWLSGKESACEVGDERDEGLDRDGSLGQTKGS